MVVRTLAFVIVRRVLGLVGLGSAPDAKDIEIAVLRHQLMVVRRQVARPRYAPADRMVLAVLARLLPQERWSVFLVTPATLLRYARVVAFNRPIVALMFEAHYRNSSGSGQPSVWIGEPARTEAPARTESPARTDVSGHTGASAGTNDPARIEAPARPS